MNRIVRRILKILGWTMVSIVLLLILVIILIQIPGVQNFARKRIIVYLEHKIGTKVEIKHLSIEFPKQVVLQGVYFEDQNHDTLLAGAELKVDIAMFRLLQNEVEINNVELSDIRANIYRKDGDSAFNYEYIVRAFVGDQKNPDTSSGSPMHFDVKHVKLHNVVASFSDDQTGNDMYASIGDFETHITRFNLDSLDFKIPDFTLSNFVARIYQHKPLVEPKTVTEVIVNNKQPINIKLDIGTIDLNNIDADFMNDVSAFHARTVFGELHAEARSIDLQSLVIDLKNLRLSNSNTEITLGNTQQAEEVEKQVEASAEAQVANPWKLMITDLDIRNNNLKFDNNTQPHTAGLDYGHLGITALSLKAKSLAFTPTVFQGIIDSATFSDQCGFNLHRLHTKFYYNDKGVALNDLYLETDHSVVKNTIAVSWPSLEALQADPGLLGLSVDLQNSDVYIKDILVFAPILISQPIFRNNQNSVLHVSTKIRGYVNNMSIPYLDASINHTAVRATGRIIGLPDPNRTTYNLDIANVQTTEKELLAMLPAGSIPTTIRLPETMKAHGTFAGTMLNFKTHLYATTSRGYAEINGAIRNMGQSYDLDLTANALDLGYIMKQEKTMGKMTGHVIAKGSGSDPNKLTVSAEGAVASFTYNGYTYSNLSFSGNLDHGNGTVHAVMHDPNLSFEMDGTALANGTYPALKANIMLDSANLKALGFYKEEMKVHGRIIADLSNSDPDALAGTINISDIVIATGGKRYITDTVRIAAGDSLGAHYLTINSEALIAELRGDYKLTEIAIALQQSINKYYHIAGTPTTPVTPENWTLNAKVIPSNLLFAFVPQLKGSDTINAHIGFNSAQNDLNALVTSRKLIAMGNAMDSLNATVQSGSALDYNVSVLAAGNKQFHLHQTTVNGNVANDQVTTNLDTKDPAGKSKYQLAATLNALPNDGYRISLLPGLMMEYQTWAVGTNNYIQYDPSGIVVNNFSISNGTQSLSASSTQLTASAPINVQFTNFQIGTITRIAEQDSLLMNGVINGTAQVSDPLKNPSFTSDIAVNDFSYLQDTIGNILVKVNNQTAGVLNANVNVAGHGNDITLSGLYYINDQRMNMNLDIASMNLALIKPFTSGLIDSSGGNLKGNLAIGGTVSVPAIDGNVHFENAFLAPTMLGERFSLTNEDININNTGIHLGAFTIADSANNKAVIGGDVLTNDFKYYQFNLNVNSDHFRAVNASKSQTKQPFYGRLYVTSALKVTGDNYLPVVQGNVSIDKGTDFSYILPANDPEIQSREGVVEFRDIQRPHDTSTFIASADTLEMRAQGIDLSANIETDSAANFTVVIDERNGDALRLRGSADLNASVDKSGKVSLTGTYILREGSYLLTLNFLKRKFEIEPGSVITWNGDPTDATVDVTATYIANTAPLDLVAHQLDGQNQNEINKYKQRLPFTVYLRMKGQLMKPIISFDIDLPDRYASQWQDVSAKLNQIRQDESELNKQVFALLLLNRFVDENPFESSGGGDIAQSFIRQSASRILTDQLNRLAGNLIKGVDLTFGVNSGSDYSTGDLTERTDLTVGVSKRLLNDRLRVNVGSSFEVEGATLPNQQASNIAGDVSLDYQLSKDGRYNVRVYRQNDYESVTEGQVIETGATFVFKIDYNSFREFFRNPDKKKKK